MPAFGLAALLAAALIESGRQLAIDVAPPSPHTSLPLTGGAYLHLYALPLGFVPGSVVGDASFDSSGTRAVFVGAFPDGALFGDPRRMNPAQAFMLDIPRRRLTQLTTDGSVRSAHWSGPDTIDVLDGDEAESFTASPARVAALPARRFSSDQSLRGVLDVVSGPDADRVTVYRRGDGRYVVREIGARRLRVNGVSAGGGFALLGDYLAWVDSRAGGLGPIDRAGASNAIPPRFNDPFGRQLIPVFPLASATYQGSYRNGVAYFAFSYGLTRVVAATRDLVSYFYPAMPTDPAYSVGDGLGALDDGGLYLAWPEGLRLSVRRAGRFATLPMAFPAGYSDPQALISSYASTGSTNGSAVWPPFRPDEDALDAALLQWRVYPVGAGSSADSNTKWVSSYLGHLYLSDARATFAKAQPPVFPFAVLSRTDDGTLWGASPARINFGNRASSARSVARPSTLWSSRDGEHWRVRYALDGSPGAVGSNGSLVWAALTKPWHGSAMICVAKLSDDANPVSYPTGGSYAGEQIFFASLANGMSLVWGATPGRSPADQGALSAFRIDAKTLSALDDSGLNAYARTRIGGTSVVATGSEIGDPAMLEATIFELSASAGGRRPTLATNVTGAQRYADLATTRSLDDETKWESEFGDRPAPLGIVSAAAVSGDIEVTRSLWLAPLRGHGSIERWHLDAGGAWRLAQTLRNWSL